MAYVAAAVRAKMQSVAVFVDGAVETFKRLTEAGDTRITEGGETRIQE